MTDDTDSKTGLLERLFSVFFQIHNEPVSYISDTPEAPSRPTYAVGDIHGRFDLLELLLQKIFDHANGEPAEIIFLGDYIDRGPQSCEVIEYLASSAIPDQFDCVFLKGNHEETLLEFLENASLGPSWLEYGGMETLRSYGTRPPTLMTDEEAWDETRLSLRSNIPPSHLSFLEGLQVKVERGGYFFVHAGVNPSKSLAQQSDSDLMWIRSPFLKSSKRHERIIVHGHTPAPTPFSDHRRIGVDTGAYQSGVLTAAVITTGPVQFLMTD